MKKKKKNPPTLRERGGCYDVQIVFGRNGRRLFYLLTGEGVGLIASEDEDLAVGNYFLSAFRHRSQFNGLVF